MKLQQGDAVLIRAKVVSVDGSQATVSLSSTDFAIVPLSVVFLRFPLVQPIRDVPFGTGRRSYGRTPEKNVPRGGKAR